MLIIGSDDNDGRLALTVLKSLFVHQDALDRHLRAPMLEERRAYLAWLMGLGRKRRAITVSASTVCHVIRLLSSTGTRAINEADIASAAERYASETNSSNVPYQRSSVHNFKTVARSWYQFLGLYIPQAGPSYRYESEYAEFADALSSEFHYLPSSIPSYMSPVRQFLVWVSTRQTDLTSVSLEDIDEYLAEGRAGGWAPRTIIGRCRALRAFFRYAERRGWNHRGLDKTINAPSFKFRPGAPKCPSLKQVRRLLNSLDDSNASHCRAKAILLLAAVYGLRRCEITRLTLDDFDWYNEVLTVRRAKRGRLQQFPLQFEVGEAIIRYLRNVRPPSKSRRLFLTLQVPYRPAENIGPAMRRILNAQGLSALPCGLHSLRHACATELLRQGTSLRGIADFLGHRSIRSVSIYARCDLRALRKVADLSLQGVL